MQGISEGLKARIRVVLQYYLPVPWCKFRLDSTRAHNQPAIALDLVDMIKFRPPIS